MNEESFLIQFTPSKDCFLQFSNKWFQKLNNSKWSCLRITHPVTKQELRFTWSSKPNYRLNDCSVGINATFANSLNLHENEYVIISSEERIVQLTQVFLIPLSTDDYEILELSQYSVEESLLNQIRIINVQQIVPVWVSKTIHLKLTVDRIVPEALYGRLQHMSELVIENITKPESVRGMESVSYSQNATDPIEQNKQKHESVLWGQTGVTSTSSNNISQSINNSWLLRRVHPFPSHVEPFDCCNRSHDESLHPFNVFICKNSLQKEKCQQIDSFYDDLIRGYQSAVICKIENIPLQRLRASKSKITNNKANKIEKSDENDEIVNVCVRLYKIEDNCEFFKTTQTNVLSVCVSQFLRRILGLSVGCKVRLTAFKPSLHKMLSGITLTTSSELNENEAEKLVNQLSERLPSRDGLLINNLCPLNLDPPVSVCLSPPDLLCWPLTRPQLEVCAVNVAFAPDTDLAPLSKQNASDSSITSNVTSIFGELEKEGISTIDFSLSLSEDQYQDMFIANILITGKSGSGKSRLAEAIYSRLSKSPYYLHVSIINCKSLRGKKPESIANVIGDHLRECVFYNPSVLVLEDLPYIAGMLPGDQEPSSESGYFLKVASIIKELIWDQKAVSVLATAESRQKIHPHLLSARGRHTFTTFLNITPLRKVERVQLLSDLTEKYQLPISRLEDVGSRTEGCVARDLCRLVDRAMFNMCKRSDVSLSIEDLDAALQGFVPEGLSNTSLTHHSPHTFSSVGGLLDAKQLLTEVLIWPSKYQEIFRQCPLQLERGVLLYGAPGTGKTLLASAVAGECGLNFITVKGPELLSKYIGASEEAVRNIFQKAQSAQPCILFFDEFDSLAPRRGHDSTGVTDRVVNQLLTQMDGVEALEGVWVVAAASRPDLLDRALLRPGRIGTLVYCPLPNQEERLAILESLSNRLQLSGDLDLAVIASQTEGFTGADIQALLFTAQMAAFDSVHTDSEDDLEMVASPMNNVAVSQAHLLAALEETTPSLKPQERKRFENIYEDFQKNKENGGCISTLPQRVTLA